MDFASIYDEELRRQRMRTQGLEGTLAEIQRARAEAGGMGGGMGGAYSPEAGALTARVAGAYQPMQDAARPSVGGTAGAPSLLDAIALTQGDPGPRDWEGVSADFASRFPELDGAGRDYGAFISKRGEDGRVRNYQRSHRGIGANITAEPIEARSLNVSRANDSTANASMLRRQRSEDATARRVAGIERQRQETQEGGLLNALLGADPRMAQVLGGMIEGQQDRQFEMGARDQTREHLERKTQLENLARLAEAGTISFEDYQRMARELMSGGEGGVAAGPMAPPSLEDHAQRIAEEKARTDALTANPEVRRAVLGDLLALDPATVTREDLAGWTPEMLEAEARRIVDESPSGSTPMEAWTIRQLYKKLTGREMRGFMPPDMRAAEAWRMQGDAGSYSPMY